MSPEQMKKSIENMRKQPKGNFGSQQPSFDDKKKDKQKGK